MAGAAAGEEGRESSWPCCGTVSAWPALADGNDVSATTVRRRRDELFALLVACSA